MQAAMGTSSSLAWSLFGFGGRYGADGLEQRRWLGASSIAGFKAAPILERAEHGPNIVALAGEQPAVGDRHFADGLGQDAGGDAAVGCA